MLFRSRKCDVVLPLVAIATPATYVREPLRVFELDFEANLPIIRHCVKYKKRVVFPSTSEVYGASRDKEFDPETSELATASCPTTRSEVYVNGSAPTQYCELHGGHGIVSSTGSFLSHIFGGGSPKPASEPPKTGTFPPPNGAAPTPALGPDGQPLPGGSEADANTPEKKKKNPLQKVFGIFGGKKKDSDKPPKPPEKGESP